MIGLVVKTEERLVAPVKRALWVFAKLVTTNFEVSKGGASEGAHGQKTLFVSRFALRRWDRSQE